MNKNNKTRIQSRLTKLSVNQQDIIFAVFDDVAKVINKKTSYIRRFSEPRKNGLGYRCKFWGVRLRDVNVNKLIEKIKKVLPAGYTVEFSHSSWTTDLIIRTPKFTAETEGVEVDADRPNFFVTSNIDDIDANGANPNTIIRKTWAMVDFQAPMCPPMVVTVFCEVEIDNAGNVVRKEATDLEFSCPAMPEATTEELGGTMQMMSNLFGVEGIQEAVVTAGKKGLQLCVEECLALYPQDALINAGKKDTAKVETIAVDADPAITNIRNGVMGMADKLKECEARIAELEQTVLELQEEKDSMESMYDTLVEDIRGFNMSGAIERAMDDAGYASILDTNAIACTIEADVTNALENYCNI